MESAIISVDYSWSLPLLVWIVHGVFHFVFGLFVESAILNLDCSCSLPLLEGIVNAVCHY